MKQGQRLTENGHDVALFPMQFLRITQPPMKVGETHEGTMNIDIAGIDGGISDFFAPFTMKVIQNNNTKNHEIIWWSTDLVKCADGSLSLLSMRTLHDDDVSDLPVGKVFAQGELCTQEGNTGDSHGNHVHLCVAKGHTTKISVKASGYRDLVGSVNPQDVFFVNETIIGNTMGMNFKYYKAPIVTPPIVEPIATENGCEEEKQPEPVIIIEPIKEPEIVIPVIIEPEPTEEQVTQEPITEPTQIEVDVPITNTNETQTTHHEPVNALYKVIIAIIELILKLIKGK